MRGIGYIAGNSLNSLQQQWVELLEVNVDCILFDQHYRNLSLNEDELTKIQRYIDTMEAGQEILGNYPLYNNIQDLAKNDTLVITSLDILSHAIPTCWETIYNNSQRGVHLVVLDHGFHSAKEFGANVLQMMNKAYLAGKQSHA